MRKGLTKNIFYGFFFGILLGITLSIVKLPNSFENIILDFLNFGGDIFLKTIKMLVVPIVFFSIVNGVANLNNINSLGRIGFKSIFLYLTTTFLAITISLILANFLILEKELILMLIQNRLIYLTLHLSWILF